MSTPEPSVAPPPHHESVRLLSWKEIAGYLGCDVRTAQRQEKAEGLPVHRYQHLKKGSVFAYANELDTWRQSRTLCAQVPQPALLIPVSPKTELPAETLPAPPVQTQRWTYLPVSAAVLVCAVLLIVVFVFRRYASDPPLIAMPLTTEKGSEISPSFSPDGTQVVYTANGVSADDFHLYTRTIGSSTSRVLAGEEGVAYSPAWSPDGRTIAYLRGQPLSPASLMTIPVSGGTPHKVLDLNVTAWPWRHDLDWSPDGRWLVTAERSPVSGQQALVLVSVATGERRWLTQPSMKELDNHPRFAPDGRTILFARDIGPGRSSLFLLPLGADLVPHGELRHLMWAGFETVHCENPEWMPDGREVLFLADRSGSGWLWRASLKGGTPQLLATLGQNLISVAVARSAHRLVLSRRLLDVDLWQVPLGSEHPRPAPVITSTRIEDKAQFSPDGQRVAFESDRSGSAEVWVSDRDGSHAVQLTSFGGPMTGSPHWSPDGKQIVFDSRAAGQPEIYVISAEGGHPRRLTNHPAQDVIPCYSPDGQWIYFTSNRTGMLQIWRMPAQGGDPVPVTIGGGWAGQPSPDGHWIYYLKTRDRISPLWRVPAMGGVEEMVLPSVVERGFVPTRDGVYYLTGALPTMISSVQFLDLSARKVRPIVTLPKPVYPGLALSPDGKTLLYSQVELQGNNLMVVEGVH